MCIDIEWGYREIKDFLYPTYGSVFMSKGFESRKNFKKKPTMTLKEKRQKKHEKKISKEQHEPIIM